MQDRVRVTKRTLTWAAAVLLLVIVSGSAQAAAQAPHDVAIVLADGHRLTYAGIRAAGQTDAADLAWRTMKAQAATKVTNARRRPARTRAAARKRYDVSITLADGHREVVSGVRAPGRRNAAAGAWQTMRGAATTSAVPAPTPQPPPTPPPSAPPPPAPSPPPPPAQAGDQFPRPATSGTPAGWVPLTTISQDITLSQDGAALRDVRLINGADITVTGRNVTIRRVELIGGYINNQPGRAPCGNGLLIEDTSVLVGPGDQENGAEAAISYGGYTARRPRSRTAATRRGTSRSTTAPRASASAGRPSAAGR